MKLLENSLLVGGVCRSNLLPHLAIGLLSVVCMSTPVMAQSSDGGIETVVVTAQKRAENIQSVPMSITAFSGDTLENQNIHNVNDLAQLVPNLTINQANNNRNSQIYIRGVGTSGTNPGIDPDVGVYLDGVYSPASGAIQANLLDIATIEVLRGPQGTLYGRNTAVGAVNINTRKPTQVPEAMIDASVGNYSAYRVSGYFGGGLTDNLAGRMSLYVSSHEGYEKNLYYNAPTNGSQQHGGRGRLLWTPTENLSVDLIGYYTKIQQDCCTADQIAPLGVGGIATPGFLAAMAATGHPFINFDGKDHKVDDETVGNDDTTNWGVSVKADWELPWRDTLTSITAYDSYFDNISTLVADGLPVTVFHGSQPFRRKTVSEELRIASPSDQFLEYVAGAYFFHESLDYNTTFKVGQGASRVFPVAGGVTLHPGDSHYTNYDQTTKSYAFYAQATAHLTSRLRFTGGVRYSSDSKNASLLGTDKTSGNPIQTMIFTHLMFPPVSLPDLKRTDSEVTWLTSAQYDITKGIMVYATAGTGYKDGGFNASANSPSSSYAFDPESTTNYELGIKSTLFGDHLVLNADIFRMLIKGFQASTLDPKTGTGFIVNNAGSRRVQGVEVEAHARLFDHLSLSGALAYSDAEYTDYPDAECPLYPGPVLPTPNPAAPGSCSFTGLTPAFNPKWHGSLTAQWEQPFYAGSDLNWFAMGSLAYTSGQYLDESLDPRSYQDTYTIVNAQIGIDANSGWRVALWARNLTDVSYYKLAVPQPVGALVSGGGFAGADGFAGWYGPPRTFGVEANYRF